MKHITKEQFVNNAIWKTVEQVAAKGVSFIVSIILARLLTPDDYGVIAITTIFLNLMNLLIDNGFSTAIIRKEDADDADYNCVFIISLMISITLYLVLFFGAPYIAEYYGKTELTAVLRVLGLSVFAQAFTATRMALVVRQLRFKFLFFCNTVASIISGILGIALAYLGKGVWALVFQQLTQQFIVALILVIKVKWNFSFTGWKERFKPLFSFSIGVVGSSILNYVSGSLYSLVIGKKYSVTDLGYYEKGPQLPMQVSLYTFGSISSVLLATLSSYQDDMVEYKRVLRKVYAMTAVIIFPLMVGMAATAEDIVYVIFTEKWLPIVPIMIWGCAYYLATPFMLVNVQVFFSLGHSNLRMRAEIERAVLLVIGLVVFGYVMNCSIVGLAAVGAGVALINMLLTFVEVRRLINYYWSELLKDITKPAIASAIMAVAVILFGKISIGSSLLKLIIEVILGAVLYAATLWLMKSDAFLDILNMVAKRVLKK